jgi:hypothetical protein
VAYAASEKWQKTLANIYLSFATVSSRGKSSVTGFDVCGFESCLYSLFFSWYGTANEKLRLWDCFRDICVIFLSETIPNIKLLRYISDGT